MEIEARLSEKEVGRRREHWNEKSIFKIGKGE